MPRPGRSPVIPSGFGLLLSRFQPRTTTARIGLMVFAALMVGSSGLLIFLEQITRAQLEAEARSRVAAISTAAETAWQRGGRSAALIVLNGELQVPGPLVIHLAGPDNAKVTGNLPTWPAALPRAGRYHKLTLFHSEHRTREPFLVAVTGMPDGHCLLVGRSLEAEVKLQQTLAETLIAALVVAFVLSWLTSLYIARLIGTRAQRIAEVVGAVTEGDLSRRVAVPAGPPGDAFDSMGNAFNAMLARLENLLDELRAVTDGLAHDLRSPLTRLRARIDRLDKATTVDAADLAAISAEADSLLAMLDNSLEISRAEAGIGRDSFAELDLAALVTDLAEMYEPLAEEQGVSLRATPAAPVPVVAHRQLLGRALSNLIDNALRYGAAGSEILLSAETTPDGARLLVGDRGQGIPATKRGEALRRFGRLDAARPAGGSRGQGAGLGLALAAAIARLHGGSLTLSDNRPGLLVAIDLPARPAAE